MDKLKILIADASEEIRSTLAETLQGTYHIRSTGNGMQALHLLRTFLPDVLVLDLMLPELDGITLLQKAAENGISTMTLTTSRFYSDYALESVQRLGVSYAMVKPCNINAIISRVSDLSQRLHTPAFSTPDPRVLVSNTLLRLGIATKLHGYGYLREAIILLAKDPGQSITKELYPSVAAQFRSTAVQVERSIRSAIHTAWAHGDNQIWQQYFPANDSGSIPRPTNASFISRLANILILGVEPLAKE